MPSRLQKGMVLRSDLLSSSSTLILVAISRPCLRWKKDCLQHAPRTLMYVANNERIQAELSLHIVALPQEVKDR